MKTSPLVVSLLFFQAIAGAQTTKPSAIAFPTFGVSVAAPEGFVPIPEGGMGHVARWAKVSAGSVTRVITVEIEPCNGRTLDQRIKEAADQMLIRSAPVRTTLDQAPAFTLKVDHPSPGLKPVEAVFAVKGNYFYVLSEFATPNDPAGDELAVVRDSFHFLGPEEPARHLAPRMAPFPVFGRFLMNVPGTMRPQEGGDRQTIRLALYNYHSGRGEFFVEVALLPTGGVDLPTLCKRMSPALRDKLGLSQTPAWSTPAGEPLRTLSEPLESHALPNTAGSDGVVFRYAIVGLGDQSALLTFTSSTPAESDRKAYDSAASAIVNSIAPIKHP